MIEQRGSPSKEVGTHGLMEMMQPSWRTMDGVRRWARPMKANVQESDHRVRSKERETRSMLAKAGSWGLSSRTETRTTSSAATSKPKPWNE